MFAAHSQNKTFIDVNGVPSYVITQRNCDNDVASLILRVLQTWIIDQFRQILLMSSTLPTFRECQGQNEKVKETTEQRSGDYHVCMKRDPLSISSVSYSTKLYAYISSTAGPLFVYLLGSYFHTLNIQDTETMEISNMNYVYKYM